ncbi:hypothetical protein [Candidatus Nesciobacter abundans]|uniref:S1-like domain-containing protein n=1 Tax=Candidatus Nesciobacter abundans TaxID=2601668 RepID=A0A5C0UH36_9PROT|nr:hypothetical protein [Candidatus Nesciobacter abundans]QEK38981.1 hypothetical protein FZC36_00835 [Candidatus Nesciobacter abundans]
MNSKQNKKTLTGTVKKIHRGYRFSILLDLDNKTQIEAELSGRLKNRKIRIVAEDKVVLEFCEDNPSSAKIVFRETPNRIKQVKK